MCKISGVQYSGTPAGTILPCGNGSALPRTVLCNGGQYSKTDPIYAALFAAIGITFGETNGSGGVGTTHFRVPDTRGIFLRGAGSQVIGASTYSATIGTSQNDQTGAHTHNEGTLTANINHNGGNLFSQEVTAPASYVSNFNAGIAGGFGGSSQTDGVKVQGVTATNNAITSNETRPANVGINYCIAY
jgi:hypothetical protein